jgi:hypothetical protein
VAVSCKHDNEPSSSIKDREYLDQLSGYWNYKCNNIHVDIRGRPSKERCMVSSRTLECVNMNANGDSMKLATLAEAQKKIRGR